MAYLELIRLALTAISTNKMRSFLTMLGIIIGVGAVIAMIGIGEGSKRASVEAIQSMGSNMLMISNGSSQGRSTMGPMAMGSIEVLKEEHAELISRELAGSCIVAASPQVRTGRPVAYQNNNTMTQIQGSNTGFPLIRGWQVQDGRFFTESEVKGQAKVCVIGTTVKDALFPNGESPIGMTIRIGKMPFEVVGLLESKGAGMMGDQDDVIVAPYTTVMRKIMGRDRIQSINVSAMEGKSDLAEAEITALLRQALKVASYDQTNPFTIRKQDDWVKMSEQQSGIITTLLAVAATISLIVGGIGISNIMLVSVTERTREIGIRRALGATQHSVMWQFLTEAIVLSSMGGIVGALFAFGTVWTLQQFEVPAVIESWAVGLGIGFSAVVGIVAGFLPALKAAKLDVIDALRYE